jgi:lauroyl/myristoyl acyltransferase
VARDDILDDLVARQLPEVRNRLQKNLALNFPKKIDDKKAHALHQWYKNKRNKIK